VVRHLGPAVLVAALALGASACSATHKTTPARPTTTKPVSPSSIRTAPTSPPSTAPATSKSCIEDAHAYTQPELAALRPAVDRMVDERALVEIGTGLHAIVVGLQPGQERLTAALEGRFHNAVSITVGNAPYHCGVGTAPMCPAVPGADLLRPGLHLTLHLGVTTMRATETSTAKLVVRNDDPSPLGMDPGQPLIAMIVVPGTRIVVGAYRGPVSGTGIALNVHDGEEYAIDTIVGAARCDGRPGSTVPPGRYGVRAGISSNEGPPTMLAPEVPITITR
jgi:hypothetical protein